MQVQYVLILRHIGVVGNEHADKYAKDPLKFNNVQIDVGLIKSEPTGFYIKEIARGME